MPSGFVDFGGDGREFFDSSQRVVEPTDIKLYRYIPQQYNDYSYPPIDVDYVTGISGRLHPTSSIIVDGEIRRIDYYASANPPDAYGNVSYSDLVVREDFAYIRDAIGFARARTHTITWYKEDETPHEIVKTRIKYYENEDSLREGQKRRNNITDKLAMDLSGWLIATQTQVASMQGRIDIGRDFMRYHKLSFDMFTEAASSQILYDIRDDATPQHEWLDDYIAAGVTIRATILDALNIWNLDLSV